MRPLGVGSPLPPDDQIDRLFRAAWALCGEREQAEDLAAATYARTLLQPPALRRGDDPSRLLRELRRTLAATRREERRRGAQPRAPQPLEAVERPAPAPDDGMEPRAVYSAVAALPEELRDVLVAIDVAGLSRRQAAWALRVREASLGRRLDRARAELARALAARGGE
jgi:RNA polymerase sigma-70 factor (ECF subfamily)